MGRGNIPDPPVRPGSCGIHVILSLYGKRPTVELNDCRTRVTRRHPQSSVFFMQVVWKTAKSRLVWIVTTSPQSSVFYIIVWKKSIRKNTRVDITIFSRLATI